MSSVYSLIIEYNSKYRIIEEGEEVQEDAQLSRTGVDISTEAPWL